MNKARLEAFSDGVIAIILTIMVLELKVPHAGDPESFQHFGNQMASYVLSFVYVAIYWVNHHHTFHAIQKVNGMVLWLNILLLFFLSLFPFCTAWIGESHFESLPVMVYGGVLIAAALSYYALTHTLAVVHGPRSVIAEALGQDWKGRVSVGIYVVGLLVAIRWPVFGYFFYVLTAALWLVPDPRIEKRLLASEGAVPKKARRPSGR